MQNRYLTSAQRWGPTALVLIISFAPPVVKIPALLMLMGFYPGYVFLSGSNLASEWKTGGRLVLSVAFSLVITPVVLNLIWQVRASDPFLLFAAAFVALQILALIFIRHPAEAPMAEHRLRLLESRGTRMLAVAVGLIVLVATIGPYWPHRVGDWIAPCAIHDFIKHNGMLVEMRACLFGQPLSSPFFAAGVGGPIYYYHFFYLVPATIGLSGSQISNEWLFAIQSATVALALAGTVYCLVKRISRSDAKATLAMLLATVIGGLDVVMLVIFRLPVITIDAWADHTVRIHNLLNQMIWSPQNVQGLLVGLTGAYLLSCKGWWRGWWWCAPLWCLSLIGSSIWVAVPLALGVIAFVISHIMTNRGTRMKSLLQAAGVGGLCILVCWPTVNGYLEMSRRLGEGLTTDWPHQSHALLGRLVSSGALANLMDLWWVLLIEFGALAVLPILVPRSRWKIILGDAGLRLMGFSTAAAIVGFILVRSHFDYNDFGQKSMMVALLFAALTGGFAVTNGAQRWWNPIGWQLEINWQGSRRLLLRTIFALCIVCGLAVGLYEAPLTAVRRFVDPDGPYRRLAPEDAQIVKKERDAYLWMSDHLDWSLVLQAHWTRRRLPLAQMAGTRIGVTELERDTKVFCPPDPAEHQRALDRFIREIETGDSAKSLLGLLEEMNVTHVFVGVIEKDAWPRIERFEDTAYFRPVYKDASVTIYTLPAVYR